MPGTTGSPRRLRAPWVTAVVILSVLSVGACAEIDSDAPPDVGGASGAAIQETPVAACTSALARDLSGTDSSGRPPVLRASGVQCRGPGMLRRASDVVDFEPRGVSIETLVGLGCISDEIVNDRLCRAYLPAEPPLSGDSPATEPARPTTTVPDEVGPSGLWLCDSFGDYLDATWSFGWDSASVRLAAGEIDESLELLSTTLPPTPTVLAAWERLRSSRRLAEVESSIDAVVMACGHAGWRGAG